MSSTNRGLPRSIFDHYVTPTEPIRDFLKAFLKEVGYKSNVSPEHAVVLDPCAGGNAKYDMPYPTVLKEFGYKEIHTMDIREDSRAAQKCDFLTVEKPYPTPLEEYHQSYRNLIITNPPFDIALDIIRKSLEVVPEGTGGYIIMLLRLNFFGSQGRKWFFEKYMPKYCFIHSKRISFFPEDFIWTNDKGEQKVYKKGSTDSIEYAHFAWNAGYKENYCKTLII